MSNPASKSQTSSSSRPFASMADRTRQGTVSFEARPEIKQQTFDEIYGVPENFLEIEVRLWRWIEEETVLLLTGRIPYGMIGIGSKPSNAWYEKNGDVLEML